MRYSVLSLVNTGLFVQKGNVQELDDAGAAGMVERIEADSGAKAMVLMQYASWCPHCQHSAPLFSQLADQFSNSYYPGLIFAGIDCPNYPHFCSTGNFETKSYPTIRLVTKSGITKLETSHLFQDAKKALEYLKTVLHPVIGFQPNLPTQSFEFQLAENREQRWTHENGVEADTRLEDAAETVRFILREQVGEGEALTAARLGQVLAFLTVLSVTFPNPKFRADCSFLAKNLPQAGEKKSKWLDMLGLTTSFRSAAAVNYLHCGGFSCGLWQLFHILAVCSDLTWRSDRVKSSSASDVLLFTFETVKNFFNCQECRDHFIEDFEAKKFDRPEMENVPKDELILWLFRVHNGVTSRVAPKLGYRSIDTTWPRPCPDCSRESELAELYRSYWNPMWIRANLRSVAVIYK